MLYGVQDSGGLVAAYSSHGIRVPHALSSPHLYLSTAILFLAWLFPTSSRCGHSEYDGGCLTLSKLVPCLPTAQKFASFHQVFTLH